MAAVRLAGVPALVKRCSKHFLIGRLVQASRCLSISSTRWSSEKQWTDRADTVIVGGGCIGVSIAYHLAKAGVKDVVLLEKTDLTAGSTWHAAGLTTSFNPTINMKNIHQYSVAFYKGLQAETGQETGLHVTGSIRVGGTPERMDYFRYHMTRQRWNEAEAQLLDTEGVCKLHPLVNPDKCLGGLYTPGDGHVDPYSLTQAMAIGARMYGAQIVQGTPVTGMKQTADGNWEVDTPKGTIKANRVVNATGFWAREMSKMAGLDLPLLAIHHQYLVTSTIPEVAALEKEPPVLRDLEGSYYLRQERTGLLLGPWEDQTKMLMCDDWYRDGVPPGFGKELFECDLDRLSEPLEAGMELIPVMKTADIQSVVCGPIMYTPDGLPMVGPVRNLHNYWSANGFGMYGVVHSGGIGKFISDWMLDGEPPYELFELDADRFGPWADTDFTLAKVRESYGLGYKHLVYPHEQRWAGRPTRRVSGIYPLLKEKGADFGFHSGWEVPHWFALPGDDASYKPSFRRTNWFEPVGRECEMVMNRAGVIDLTTFGKIEVEGPDASKYIDYMCANTVPKVGQTCISHMLTPRGNVYSELTVTQLKPNHFLCLTGSGSEFHDLRWMEDHAWRGGFDVSISNSTEERGCLGLAGPKSRDILQKLTSADLSSKAWPFLHARDIKIGDVDTLAIRISYTGELGWEIYMNMDDQRAVYEALLEAGQEYGVGHFGTFAMSSMRLEKGFRGWGHEMTKEDNPIEAGLGMFVKKNKPADFIGKDAIRRLAAEPGPRKLVFLTVDTTDVDPEGDEAVWCGDKVIGHTTSGSYGHTVKKSIAFAYVPTEYAQPGTQLEVELLGSQCKAQVEKGAPLLIEPARNRAKSKAAKK